MPKTGWLQYAGNSVAPLCRKMTARLLLVDFWTDSTHTQPLFSALMAGAFLVDTGVGDVYSEDEGRQWLKQTGWQALERKALAGPVSVIVAEAAERAR